MPDTLYHPEAEVHVGDRLYCPELNGRLPEFITSDAALRPHFHRPHFRHYLKRHFGISYGIEEEFMVDTNSRSDYSHDTLPVDMFRRSALLCGRPGGGKTRLAFQILFDHFVAGCSAVAIDVKEESLQRVLFLAWEAGIREENIFVISAKHQEHGVVGWNPFNVEFAELQASVGAFKELLMKAIPSGWGPRMEPLFDSAATVIAGQKLTLIELYKFLTDTTYRLALMEQAKETPAWEAFRFDHELIQDQFARMADSVEAVVNKFTWILKNPFLKAMFCAPENTLDLKSLWHEQKLVLIHMEHLEEKEQALLAGMFAHTLYKTAIRYSGPIPVVLYVDEMGVQGKYMCEALTTILNVARSQNLRLIVACQNMGQFTEGLKEALLTTTAFRAFFCLGPDDARFVGSVLSRQVGEEVRKVRLTQDEGNVFWRNLPVEVKLFKIYKRPTHPDPDINRITQMLGPEYVGADDKYVTLPKEVGEAFSKHYYNETGSFSSWDFAKFAEQYTVVPYDVHWFFLHGKKYQMGSFDPGIGDNRRSFNPLPIPRSCVYISGDGLTLSMPKFKASVMDTASRSERASEIAKLLSTMPDQHAIFQDETGFMWYAKGKEILFPGDKTWRPVMHFRSESYGREPGKEEWFSQCDRLPSLAEYASGFDAEAVAKNDEHRRDAMESLAMNYQERMPQPATPAPKGKPRATPQPNSQTGPPDLPNGWKVNLSAFPKLTPPKEKNE